MPHYYFNIRDGVHFDQDTHGEELADLAYARQEAMDRSRDLLADADLVGDDYASTQKIEITDSQGSILLEVPVREAEVSKTR